MKRADWIVISCSVAFLLVCAGSVTLVVTLLGAKRYDTQTIALKPGGEMRIIATREGQIGLNAPGGIFEYSWRADPTQEWMVITTFRYRTPDPVPSGQVYSDASGLVYFHHEFIVGVSSDGGRTWTIHGEPSLSFNTLRSWRYPNIPSLTIEADGTGTMTIEPYTGQQFSFDRLRTSDFGQTWQDDEGVIRIPLP